MSMCVGLGISIISGNSHNFGRKGKGFAGVMKRHGFHGLPASHGVSISHRSAGSMGQSQVILLSSFQYFLAEAVRTLDECCQGRRWQVTWVQRVSPPLIYES
jgi:hypothetical protein